MFKKGEDNLGVRYLSTLNKVLCVNDVAILWKKRDPLEKVIGMKFGGEEWGCA